MKQIRIGNAAGFWGDSPGAPMQLAKTGELDYLTLEYLAELTLSILAYQKKKNPQQGFVTEVPNVAADSDVLDQILNHQMKLVTNGGGMNPEACAQSVARSILDATTPAGHLPSKLSEIRIAACAGDDISDRLDELIAKGEAFKNIETGESIELIRDRIVSANVYLGSEGIVNALRDSADIVLTGRVADASLVVGPAIHEFDWSLTDFQRLGKATVAGHMIECGAQVSGGIFSKWNRSVDLGNIGYPIAMIEESGDCTITKPLGTGGCVTEQTCAEQLIYEIGDPRKYMTPDVVADFSQVEFRQIGPDQVSVQNGIGTRHPDQLKVSIAYQDGFAANGMIVVAGRNCIPKAHAAAEAIEAKLVRDGFALDKFHYEILGAGDSAAGVLSRPITAENEPWEVVLRVAGRSTDREKTDRLIREIAPLVTCGPPGVTGYTGARPRSHPVLSFWPCLISREHVRPTVKTLTANEWC